uniref:C-type lectin domain-containing protein n=1 Tax=Sparus aurata TaxID=8175 RepID=A0A671WFI8_SPAAU
MASLYSEAEGVSGGDVSQSANWASGNESQLCAAVSDEHQKWYTAQCLNEHGFHCSVKDKIVHHADILDWYSASQYCQAESGQLATVTRLNTGQFQMSGWIGLYQGEDETWQWIGDLQSDYRNWEEGEPLNRDCAYLNVVNQKWYSEGCSKRHEVVCYDDKLLYNNKNNNNNNNITNNNNNNNNNNDNNDNTFSNWYFITMSFFLFEYKCK